MSTQINQYLIVGQKLDFGEFHDKLNNNDPLDPDAWLDDILDKYSDNAFKGIHHYNGLCVLYDGMNGEFVFIGRVIEKSGNHEMLNKILRLDGGSRDNLIEQTKAIVGELLSCQFKDVIDPEEIDVGVWFVTFIR